MTMRSIALLISWVLLPTCNKPNTNSDTEAINLQNSFSGCVIYSEFDGANGATGARRFSSAVDYDYNIVINKQNLVIRMTPKHIFERSDSFLSKSFAWTPKPHAIHGIAKISVDKIEKSAIIYKLNNVTVVVRNTIPPMLKQIILVQDGIELKSWPEQTAALGGRIIPDKLCD